MKTILCLALGAGLGIAGVFVLNKVRFGSFTLGGF